MREREREILGVGFGLEKKQFLNLCCRCCCFAAVLLLLLLLLLHSFLWMALNAFAFSLFWLLAEDAKKCNDFSATLQLQAMIFLFLLYFLFIYFFSKYMFIFFLTSLLLVSLLGYGDPGQTVVRAYVGDQKTGTARQISRPGSGGSDEHHVTVQRPLI